MKNSKGFTLVELLGVIALIAVLAVATFEVLDVVNKENREKSEMIQMNTILNAAISYVTTSDIVLPTEARGYDDAGGRCTSSTSVHPSLTYDKIGDEKTNKELMGDKKKLCRISITLNYLIEVGVIDKVPKTPITGENYDLESIVQVFYISDSADKTAAENLFKNTDLKNSRFTKIEKPWKYDGKYMYVFSFKPE